LVIGPGLIAAVLLQAAAHSASTAAPQSPFIRDKRAYDACVSGHARAFNAAKETVESTVKAAFAACLNERAVLFFTMEKMKEDNGQKFDRQWAESFINDLIEEPLRNDTTVELFELRSGGR
jgi:hypothetical protein